MDSKLAYSAASVLVTGASGFIGGHLCRQLSQFGARVTGAYLNNAPDGDHATWLRLDLTDRQAVADAIEAVQPDYVFHLASYVAGRRDLDAVLPTFDNNLNSTLSVMMALQRSQCCNRLVITNSQEEPEHGGVHAVPSSPYAASKFAASAYARMFHALYGLPVVIARVFMVYGPDQKDWRKLVPYTILEALNGQAPELSSGLRKVDWIYVSDVVEGLLRLGCKAGLEGQTIELGSGRYHSIKQVVEEILRQIDPAIEGRFGEIPERALERECLADVAQTSDRLDWRTVVELHEGLARTIAWYREHRDS